MSTSLPDAGSKGLLPTETLRSDAWWTRTPETLRRLWGEGDGAVPADTKAGLQISNIILDVICRKVESKMEQDASSAYVRRLDAVN